MPSKRQRVSGAATAAGLAFLPLAAGCGGGDGTGADTTVAAPARVEVIASLTGCEAEIRVEADELREGVCRTAEGEYLITTFPAERYQLTWLDSAAVYGGRYLVGPRWAITARPELLEPLREKVGGTVRDLGASRGAAPGAPPASP
ncbi:hypothetical protein [Streptomyces poonensis]|uniref:Lipoprotein n=1 Tax=Streptomyces poonensis TaxID=68255 RepID=A0A918PKJ7_9ACTN|nr:hypothetical protein [Streptomyces poonensis]GGZ12879.1 hypothetical protein GCM10010365_35750 [Streptomyces poonensis]GLJ91970.1 hypothetical protein GCM10017589_45780 [Streptomyces poonensis]